VHDCGLKDVPPSPAKFMHFLNQHFMHFLNQRNASSAKFRKSFAKFRVANFRNHPMSVYHEPIKIVEQN
jgi:hypothetical protein